MKKILILFIALLTIASLTHSALAFNPLDPQFQQAVSGSQTNDELSLPTTTANTTMSNLALGVCLLWGAMERVPAGSPAYSYYQNYGLIPNIQTANVAMLMNQPASTRLWIADTGQALGFIPRQANAQGIGFSGLLPILNLWKTFRNLAYVLLALVLIFMGFMIMFRTKIDPHTVASIQMVLPRIIISLILITFSYAIVSLFIDLSYVILFLAYNLFRTAGLPTTITSSAFLGMVDLPRYKYPNYISFWQSF